MRPDRRTDGQTDMVIPVYPPNVVAGGIKRSIVQKSMNGPFVVILYTEPQKKRYKVVYWII